MRPRTALVRHSPKSPFPITLPLHDAKSLFKSIHLHPVPTIMIQPIQIRAATLLSPPSTFACLYREYPSALVRYALFPIDAFIQTEDQTTLPLLYRATHTTSLFNLTTLRPQSPRHSCQPLKYDAIVVFAASVSTTLVYFQPITLPYGDFCRLWMCPSSMIALPLQQRPEDNIFLARRQHQGPRPIPRCGPIPFSLYEFVLVPRARSFVQSEARDQLYYAGREIFTMLVYNTPS